LAGVVKRGSGRFIIFVGRDLSLPRDLAAATACPGGYGIRPYGVGVGVLDDPGRLRRRKQPGRNESLPYNSAVKARFSVYLVKFLCFLCIYPFDAV